MSKQLTLSASIAVLSMALFAVAITLAGSAVTPTGQGTGVPLIGLSVGR